jgi:hypothetical protein
VIKQRQHSLFGAKARKPKTNSCAACAKRSVALCGCSSYHRLGRRAPLALRVMAVVASFLWAVTAQAQSDKSDFDLVCAITTAAQMNQDEQRAAATMPAQSFYIGRLSARDDHTNWTIVIAGRLAEKQWAAPSPQLLAKCLDFYASKFKH